MRTGTYRKGQKQYFKHQGNIRIYKHGKIIYKERFLSKMHLKQIMERFKNMEMGIIYDQK